MTATQSRATPDGRGSDGPVLTVEHLDVVYKVRGRSRLALRDVSFSIGRRETYGLVGESGSGKSTVALALTRYLPRNGRVSAGSITVNGQDTLSLRHPDLRQLRARTISMVYQEPGRALNPSLHVGRQGAEAYERAKADRLGFWAEQAGRLHWSALLAAVGGAEPGVSSRTRERLVRIGQRLDAEFAA